MLIVQCSLSAFLGYLVGCFSRFAVPLRPCTLMEQLHGASHLPRTILAFRARLPFIVFGPFNQG